MRISDPNYTTIHQSSNALQSYGSTVTSEHSYYDEDSDDDDDEDSVDRLDRNASSSQKFSQRLYLFVRNQYKKIQSMAAILLDVDNIWDSPMQYNPNQNGNQEYSNTKQKLVVFFWFLMLAFAYALERASFKVMVDKAGPFRLFSAEVVTGVHALILGVGILISGVVNKKFEIKPLGIPLANVGLMALIDTIHLLFSLISGSHVTPVLTVLIVQLIIPLTVYMTKCIEKYSFLSPYRTPESSSANNHSPTTTDRMSPSDEDNTNVATDQFIEGSSLAKQHVWGASIIFIAVVLGIMPAFFHILNPALFIKNAMTDEKAWNTMVFCSAQFLAAASTLYKEHTLIHFKQPVDPNNLNFILSVFQFLIAVLISPLLYSLQGLGYSPLEHENILTGPQQKIYTSWLDVYPSKEVSKNFMHGIQCFELTQTLDVDVQRHGYAEPARCSLAGGLVLLYAFSIILVGIAVDKIVHAGATKIMYRGISAGVILAVASMYWYEFTLRVRENIGVVMDSFYAFCVVILIIGSEVYHRVSPVDATFETIYPEVENLYDDM